MSALAYRDQSLARCNEALQLAREHRYPLALAITMLAAGTIHRAHGNYKAAQEQAELLLALAREDGFADYEALALSCRGHALAMQG